MESNFQEVALAAAGSGTTELEAARITAHADGTGYGTWVIPNEGAGNNASITLVDSLLDDFAWDVKLGESGGANAALTTSRSAYDSTKLSIGAGTSYTQGTGFVDLNGVDPRFVDRDSDLALRYDSPLIDAGDGNGNGSAVVDIGAHEYQRSKPLAVASAPANGEIGQAVTFDGSGSSDPDEEALAYSWSFDDGTQAVGAIVQRAFTTPGPHTGTLTVTDPLGLSGVVAATVTIVVPAAAGPAGSHGSAPTLVLDGLRLVPGSFPVAAARRGARAAKSGGTRIKFMISQAARVRFTVHRARGRGRWIAVGSFSRDAASGANSLRWSGRIGKRALSPGRYRLTAQGQIGNGSPSDPRRKRFRILSG
jgi:PKD repeat protein